MIRLENLTKEYNLDQQVITPVDKVSLDIARGEFVMIVGRSGTGKSTLLNLAAGLIKPTSGTVVLDGRDIAVLPDSELSRFRSHKIGYIFQFPSLLPALSILENVMTPAMFDGIGPEEAGRRALHYLDILGLGDRAQSYPRHLSAGEQKRAVIARALLNSPPIILADEPTSDLDENTEQDIITRLDEIHASGITILMVTHSMNLLKHADRAFRMENGKLTNLT
jgi:ABC-type lipoprotein export system ATPase subunit